MKEITEFPINDAVLMLHFTCKMCGEKLHVTKKLLNFLIDKKLPSTNTKCLFCDTRNQFVIDWDASTVRYKKTMTDE